MFILNAIKVVVFLGIISRLFYLQISENIKYSSLSDKNRLRECKVTPQRGTIEDLFGENKEVGIGALYVDAGTKGLRLGSPENKMGWKASDTRSVYFDDMKIPKTNILGSPNKGFKQFLQTLTGGRISISALALGICQGAYNIALNYSNEREAFGKKINQFQSVSFKLADMATQIEAAKHLVYHAAWLKDNNQNIIKEAAMAKLFSSELAMNITTDAIQLLGGYGYIKEYDVERFFRDAKILEIGEGTSEIQRIIISREILKSL